MPRSRANQRRSLKNRRSRKGGFDWLKKKKLQMQQYWNGTREQQQDRERARLEADLRKKRMKMGKLAAEQGHLIPSWGPYTPGTIDVSGYGTDYQEQIDKHDLDKAYGRLYVLLVNIQNYNLVVLKRELIEIFKQIQKFKVDAKDGKNYKKIQEYLVEAQGLDVTNLQNDIYYHMHNGEIPDYAKVGEYVPPNGDAPVAGYMALPPAFPPTASSSPAAHQSIQIDAPPPASSVLWPRTAPDFTRARPPSDPPPEHAFRSSPLQSVSSFKPTSVRPPEGGSRRRRSRRR